MTASASATVRGEGRLTSVQGRTIACCFVLGILCGADFLSITYAAPVLALDLGVSDSMLGFVFSSGIAGVMLGSIGLGPLSDVFGRKTMILIAIAMIAGGMAASSFAADVAQLMLLRLWVGLGVGSMLASVTSMAAEFAPPRYKSLAVSVATAGYPIGAIGAAFGANAILPFYGWEGVFLAAAALSALMFPLCLKVMPESIDFLLTRQPPGALERVNRILGPSGGALAALPPKLPGADAHPSPMQLLRVERRRETLLVWAAFFSAFMTVYFLTSWIPKIAVQAGLPVEHAIYAGATYHLGSLTGRISLGWLSTRFSLTALITGYFTAAALIMTLFGAQHEPVALFMVEIFSIGLFAQGGFGGLNAAATRIYPTEFRATGVGWGLGIGRLGAVLGPALGGVIIAQGVGLFESFLIFASPLVVAGVIAAALGAPEDKAARAGASPPAVS